MKLDSEWTIWIQVEKMNEGEKMKSEALFRVEWSSILSLIRLELNAFWLKSEYFLKRI